MSFLPEVLLSNASRARCISNIKELPVLIKKPSAETSLASVLVPLCVHNGDLCLLYTLRSSNLNNHKGQVSFPGGKNDPNETVCDAALRETEEEIGFCRENVDVWTTMTPVRGRTQSIVITPVVGHLRNFDFNQIKPNIDEVDEVFTVSMEALCNTNNHAHVMYKSYPLPIFLCGKHKIWGITGLITHLFMTTFLPDIYKPNFMRKSYEIDELMPSKL